MNPILNRASTYMRYLMVYNLSGIIPLYVINEYPKSGGTWVGQMIAKALQVPFPRNRFPVFKESIIHGHFLKPGKMKNVVVVWRDGRDVLTSWYYHCLFVHEYDNSRLVKLTRQNLAFDTYEDIQRNLPAFIEYTFARQPNPNFSWTDFVYKWADTKNAIHVRYEDLHTSADKELKRIVYQLTEKNISDTKAKIVVNELSFKSQSRKQTGSKNSFLRKGIVGDWRNHFSQEARVMFDRYAGDALIKIGYEQNHNWVSDSHIR